MMKQLKDIKDPICNKLDINKGLLSRFQCFHLSINIIDNLGIIKL